MGCKFLAVKIANSFLQIKPTYKITKPIRLIELFAGIGAQAKALEILGVEFERYKVCEIDENAIKSYNAIHGTNFEPKSITDLKASDLQIEDKDNYEYIMTYSYPCTSISLAGKREGMARNSQTASSLIWEVERILDECHQRDELPQILLMENVPQVHNKKNLGDFQEWIAFLKSIGYESFYQDLNAKDYGIPQNRNRCYMISILNKPKTQYVFPKPIELKSRLKDVVFHNAPKTYYLKGGLVRKLLKADKDGCKLFATLQGGKWDKIYESCRRVYSSDGVSPTITTCAGGNQEVKIADAINPIICAMRGRNPENPKDRTSEIHTEQTLEFKADGLSNTITTVGKDNLLCMEPAILHQYRNDYGKSIRKSYENGEIKANRSKIQDYLPRTDGCSNTLTTVQKDNLLLDANGTIGEFSHIIRKLLPVETWRLMGFKDEDFFKAHFYSPNEEKTHKVKIDECSNKAIRVSNSQLYRQSGNSIVVNVLVAIFGQLFEGKENLYKEIQITPATFEKDYEVYEKNSKNR